VQRRKMRMKRNLVENLEAYEAIEVEWNRGWKIVPIVAVKLLYRVVVC